MHPVIDILAGLPSVIYGVWGIIVVVPFVKHLAHAFHVSVSGYSILAGAIVLAIMIIPFILNILIEVFRTIPEELTEATLSPWCHTLADHKKSINEEGITGYYFCHWTRSIQGFRRNDCSAHGCGKRSSDAEGRLSTRISLAGTYRKQLRRNALHSKI